MSEYHNEEEPITGIGDLLWRAGRTFYGKLGEIVLGAIDKADHNLADRINQENDNE